MSLFVDVQGTGPDLVLIHGWGFNHRVWDTFLPYLTRIFTVYRLDLPGYGGSPGESGDDKLHHLSDRVLEATPEGALWLGWSLGGLVALDAALRRSKHIGALSLMATSPRFVQGPAWPDAIPVGVLDGFSRQLFNDHGRTLQRFLTLQTRGAEATSLTLTALRKALASAGAPNPAALRGGLELLRDTDLVSALSGLAMPVCVILGERDTLVPVKMGDRLTELAPNWNICRIPGAGHAPFLSHPHQVRTALETCFHGKD